MCFATRLRTHLEQWVDWQWKESTNRMESKQRRRVEKCINVVHVSAVMWLMWLNGGVPEMKCTRRLWCGLLQTFQKLRGISMVSTIFGWVRDYTGTWPMDPSHLYLITHMDLSFNLKVCKPVGMDPGHPQVHSCSPLGQLHYTRWIVVRAWIKNAKTWLTNTCVHSFSIRGVNGSE